MADNRKYYYLKLKENYFDDASIVLLESMQDGMIYSNILLKLYLKSLKHSGKLQLDEQIPYTAQMIATLTRQQIGTVERALNIYLRLGLMDELPDGRYYMTNIELLIGKSSTEGERKKQARMALQAQKDGGHLSAVCPPEIELERKIEIESEKDGEQCLQPHTQLYGRYQNVTLTEAEESELRRELSTSWGCYVEKLSAYMASTGKQYQNHAATIRRWVAEDMRRNVPPSRNYSVKAGDTV